MTAAFDAALRRFAGAGGLPERRNIVLLTTDLRVTSDLCVSDGSPGSDADLDAAVARDPDTGLPILPATSQSGAVRAALSRLRAITAAHVDAVLGTTEGSAALRPHDAVAAAPVPPLGVRTGIAIDPATAITLRGHLFTTEVVSPATVFPLVWEVHLPVEEDAAATVLQLTAAAAGLLTEGRLRFGRHTHVGFGAAAAGPWRARLFDLTGRSDDVRDWYTPTLAQRRTATAEVPAHPDPAAALTAAVEGRYRPVTAPDLTPRNAATINLTLAYEEPIDDDWAPSSVLLGGGSTGVDNVTTALHRPTYDHRGALGVRPLDSGAATLNQLRRIASDALGWISASGGDPDAAARLLGDLFGSHPADGVVAAARLHVNEAPLLDSTEITLTTVALNALAHTPVYGALTNQVVRFGGHRQLRVDIADPTDADLAILRLVLADLVDGLAPPVGAGTATGHGRRRATTITAALHRDDTTRTWASWDELCADPFLADCHRHLLTTLGLP